MKLLTLATVSKLTKNSDFLIFDTFEIKLKHIIMINSTAHEAK